MLRLRERTIVYASAGTLLIAFGGMVCGQGNQLDTCDQVTPSKVVRFDGDQVVRAQIENNDQLQLMLDLSPDVWSHGVGIGEVDFRIPADQLDQLKASGIEYEVLIPDVQRLVDAEQEQLKVQTPVWFDNYKRLGEVNDYLVSLVAMRPDLAEMINLGDSYQGRAIMGIHITGSGGAPDKAGVFLNGCQHAREWVTVMTTTYIADRLIQDYDSDPVIKDMVDNHDFYIVPIVNPDGYEYTWTTNRLWRKNRHPGGGVDLNRNWSVGWGGPGSSGSNGSEIYRGTAPFSEPETQAVRDFVMAHPNILYHNDIHSYSQLILQPWGFTRELAPDHAVLDAMGQAMKDAVFAVHGMTYQHGPIFTTIYPASGVCSDWFYGARDAFSVSYELRDRGQYGFLLPADQIVPTAEEAFAGIEAEVSTVVERRMKLDLMEPMVWGGTLHLRTSRSTPGGEVSFFYTLVGISNPPGTFIPSLNVTLDLRKAKLIETANADAAGIAEVFRILPTRSTLTRVFFQSAEFERVSNWVYDDIPAN